MHDITHPTLLLVFPTTSFFLSLLRASSTTFLVLPHSTAQEHDTSICLVVNLKNKVLPKSTRITIEIKAETE